MERFLEEAIAAADSSSEQSGEDQIVGAAVGMYALAKARELLKDTNADDGELTEAISLWLGGLGARLSMANLDELQREADAVIEHMVTSELRQGEERGGGHSRKERDPFDIIVELWTLCENSTMEEMSKKARGTLAHMHVFQEYYYVFVIAKQERGLDKARLRQYLRGEARGPAEYMRIMFKGKVPEALLESLVGELDRQYSQEVANHRAAQSRTVA